MNDENLEMVEQEDGSVFIPDDQPGPQETQGFNANLAASLDPRELQTITTDLLDLIENDRESRRKRDKQYEEGLRRTGLGDDAPGGAEFEGATRVVHPVLAEACVDYSSASIKALFPSDGPVKMHQLDRGQQTDFDRAERKRDFMNWQLTEQIVEYRSELEVLLTQQPLGGSQYMKIYRDPAKRRVAVEFVPIDRVYLPFSASSFESASRRTLVVPQNRLDFRRKIESGFYVDIQSDSVPAGMLDESAAERANQKIEGKDDIGFNEDGLRNVFETYVWLDFEGDLRPYVVSIDEYTQECLAIYRNWDEGDETYQELDWVVEWQFIPWRGAYGIGLLHLIGGLATAATGALRALLDSAHISTLPGGVKLKGARSNGSSINVSATEIAELDAPPNVDDIRKVFMAWPFPGPSPVLFQLLGWLTESAKGVVSTAEEKIAEASNTMPVGTALALIEQGSKTFSAIHLRLHNAQAKVLRIIQRLNSQDASEQAQMKKFGRVLATREDFLKPDDVVPVSDPNIFSESQRYAQCQGLQQMAQDVSVPWNRVAIYRRMMSVMRIENQDEILPPPQQPFTHMVAFLEAPPAMAGIPLKAEMQQNHMSHIKSHLEFILDPVFGGGNPVTSGPGFGILMTHVLEHLTMLFQVLRTNATQQATQMAQAQLHQSVVGQIPPEALPQFMQAQMQAMQPMIEQQADMLFAQSRAQMAPLVQMMQQAQEIVKQKTPPPPGDPQSQAAIHVAQMQEQTKKAVADQTHQREMEKIATDRQMAEKKLELQKYIELSIKPLSDQMAAQIETQKNDADNRQHQMTELLKNHEDNQTNLVMEQMRQEGLQTRAELEARLKAHQDKLDAMLNAVVAVTTAKKKEETSSKPSKS